MRILTPVFLLTMVMSLVGFGQSPGDYETKTRAMLTYLNVSATPDQVTSLASLQAKTESSANPMQERVESFQTLLFQYAKLLGKDTVGLKKAMESWAARRTVKFNLPVFEALTYESTPLNTIGEVKKFGTGRIPVILIHGYRKDASMFDEFIQSNLEVYTFYAITLPGYHGTSPYSLPATYDFSNRIWLNSVVDGVIALIRNEKLSTPLLVGALNAGSYVATRVAARIPTQIRGVVLLNGALREDEKVMTDDERKNQVNGDYSNIIWYLLTRYEYSDTELDELMKRKLAPAHPIYHYTLDTVKVKRVYRMHNAFTSITERYDLEWQTTDLSTDIRAVNVRMLIVLSKYDNDWPFEPKTNRRTETWRKFVSDHKLNNIRITEVENARLLLTLDCPGIVSEVIDAFVTKKPIFGRYSR